MISYSKYFFVHFIILPCWFQSEYIYNEVSGLIRLSQNKIKIKIKNGGGGGGGENKLDV